MPKGLRIVACIVLAGAYSMVADWAARHGHQIILLMTSPAGGPNRYGTGHVSLVESVPPEQDVLITTRLRKIAVPVVAALAPDLLISATFPHRIPPELAAIPRYGALNMHPAPLPRGRGPNPQRLIYEGDDTIAGALHRIVPEFDAGPLLSLQTRQLPDEVTSDDILTSWGELLVVALEDGVPRAVAGEPGVEQGEALATYAAPFTEEERWIRWDESSRRVQLRVTALNLTRPMALALLDDEAVSIASVRPQPGAMPEKAPGTVPHRSGELALVCTNDGVVEVTTLGGQGIGKSMVHHDSRLPTPDSSTSRLEIS